MYFWATDIQKLNKEAFDEKIYSVSYACNTGTVFNSKKYNVNKKEIKSMTKLMEGKNFAQEWANHIGGSIKAIPDGYSWYGDINTLYNKKDAEMKEKGKWERLFNKFSEDGSLNYPTTSGDAEWKIFIK